MACVNLNTQTSLLVVCKLCVHMWWWGEGGKEGGGGGMQRKKSNKSMTTLKNCMNQNY